MGAVKSCIGIPSLRYKGIIAGSGVDIDSERSDNMLDRRDSDVLPGTSGVAPGRGEDDNEVMDGRLLMLGVEGALVMILRGPSRLGDDDGVGEWL